MSTQFISRVEREGPRQEFVEVGPGSYSLPGALRNSLPGFAPFASNSKRMAYSAEEGPAPGSYELASVARQTHGAGTLHSKTQRFQDGAKAEQMRGRVPGPGSYSLSSTFKDASTRKGKARPRSVSDALMNSLGAAPASMAPSIPTKFQSYGYELSEGRLELQEPLYPVYSGTRQDAVGPCEYDPKSDLRFRSVSKPNFSKSSERGSLDKMRAKMTEAPGPGYYNHRSDTCTH
ncbi:hypothetical protein B484DRAFT_471733 [Ochromonadaceae sp. CCMP2298]|nr:hypothetical protein B484DRAFT_471733 [Ochromonadaceae sp. CCMP2298]